MCCCTMDFTSFAQQHIFILQKLLKNSRRSTILMRKINAGLSLLTTFLLFAHTIFKAVSMISQGTIEKNNPVISWILLGCMLAHAVISIDLAISAHSETEKRKCKSYPKLNIATIFQRFTQIIANKGCAIAKKIILLWLV